MTDFEKKSIYFPFNSEEELEKNVDNTFSRPKLRQGISPKAPRSSPLNRITVGNSPFEISHYISSILGELKEMTDETDFKFLSYLLDLAHQESLSELNRHRNDG